METPAPAQENIPHCHLKRWGLQGYNFIWKQDVVVCLFRTLQVPQTMLPSSLLRFSMYFNAIQTDVRKSVSRYARKDVRRYARKRVKKECHKICQKEYQME